jgi:hypothetical protein
MREELHTQHTLVVVIALLLASVVPASILLSREGSTARDVVKEPAIVSSIHAAPVPLASVPAPETEDASQSISMVLVGSLLIGVGSVIRRTV